MLLMFSVLTIICNCCYCHPIDLYCSNGSDTTAPITQNHSYYGNSMKYNVNTVTKYHPCYRRVTVVSKRKHDTWDKESTYLVTHSLKVYQRIFITQICESEDFKYDNHSKLHDDAKMQNLISVVCASGQVTYSSYLVENDWSNLLWNRSFSPHHITAGTLCNCNVMITSKRRSDVVLTQWKWRYQCVVWPLGLFIYGIDVFAYEETSVLEI